ncbi:MAG: dihydroxy-acid dehydratase [Puniceicoccaceae bacterium]|nr:MAG: dihydroxy-acid dehydratase [Puniceicoccaceae bacterium]
MSARPTVGDGLNWNSRRLTRGWQRGIHAFYWGLGWEEADFERPQAGIGVPLLEANLCNLHAPRLAEWIKEGCREAGLHGFAFGVPTISDNLTQGLDGGAASLPSRNQIASAAEAVAGAHGFDGLIGLHHCDKNGPGFALALARLNFPGFILSGGTIRPGCWQDRELTIQSVYDAQAAAEAGELTAEERDAVIRHACPGPGGCGIAASFNTWGIAMEAMGLMPPGSSSNPAEDGSKERECRAAGRLLRRLLEKDRRPRHVLTPVNFRNATAAIAAAGGSTNGILHLLALAKEAGVDFSLREMQAIFRRTPVVCNFAPRGRGTMVDLFRYGGTPALLRRLLEEGILDGAAPTLFADSLAESFGAAPALPEAQDLVAPPGRPFKPHADIQICFGNLAPDGIVFKVSGRQEPGFAGDAVCFEDTEALLLAVKEKRIRPGHVVVLRGQGPVAAGMPEVLVATSALATKELDGRVAFLSDTRISGVSHGAIGVHCAPEAAVGGPIGLVRDGDRIRFDLLAGSIIWEVSEAEAERRRKEANPWPRPEQPPVYLAEFAALALQADQGCASRAAGPGGQRAAIGGSD